MLTWMVLYFLKKILLPALNTIMEKLFIPMRQDSELIIPGYIKNESRHCGTHDHLINVIIGYQMRALKLSALYILSPGFILNAV